MSDISFEKGYCFCFQRDDKYCTSKQVNRVFFGWRTMGFKVK